MYLQRCVSVIASIIFTVFIPMTSSANDSLLTIAEQSKFQKTGRYDEVIALCAAFEKKYPQAVRCREFGRTPEGRPMMALIATRTGAFTPAEAKKQNVSVLLVQGGIHAGEIDGKDAGFIALREALEKRAAKTALDKQVLIFVPVFNIDGHERFGAWNRPNQRGPEEMGWRTTAQNFNLNRDYAKADSPEMQAMLKLVNAWDPLAYIDLHVTDGAKFEHDIAIMVEPVHGGDAVLGVAGKAFRDAVLKDLAAEGSQPLPFYPSFIVNDDPTSGIADSVSPPRFSTGYFLVRNRFGMLVETHSWKDYATRVRITRNTVISTMNQIAENGAAWMKLAREADARAVSAGGSTVALTYKPSEKTRMVDFRGYEYTRTMSEISGQLMTRYDETKPQIWKMPVRDEVLPDLKVIAPRGGYIVPAAHAAWVGEKLAQHGIAFRTLANNRTQTEVETFRARETKFGAKSNESHQQLTVTGEWKTEKRDVPAGSLFVPIAQAKSRLVMSLFEPVAPDSFVSWGRFNNHFERKEYMEDYVAEEVAREMLAKDEALAMEFKSKIANDAEFAKSASARLEFFARRHSSWDERFSLYPVKRVGVVLQ